MDCEGNGKGNGKGEGEGEEHGQAVSEKEVTGL